MMITSLAGLCIDGVTLASCVGLYTKGSCDEWHSVTVAYRAW